MSSPLAAVIDADAPVPVELQRKVALPSVLKRINNLFDPAAEATYTALWFVALDVWLPITKNPVRSLTFQYDAPVANKQSAVPSKLRADFPFITLAVKVGVLPAVPCAIFLALPERSDHESIALPDGKFSLYPDCTSA